MVETRDEEQRKEYIKFLLQMKFAKMDISYTFFQAFRQIKTKAIKDIKYNKARSI